VLVRVEAVGICNSDLEMVGLETQEVCHPRLPDAAEPGWLEYGSEELVGVEQAVRLETPPLGE
jgi:threonine dehydrogenase-like Zn-dependent dehydrogenase